MVYTILIKLGFIPALKYATFGSVHTFTIRKFHFIEHGHICGEGVHY